jgi:hypothetical protein
VHDRYALAVIFETIGKTTLNPLGAGFIQVKLLDVSDLWPTYTQRDQLVDEVHKFSISHGALVLFVSLKAASKRSFNCIITRTSSACREFKQVTR